MPRFIPIGNSIAGLCLTAANWQEIQVTTLCFYLDTLLVKPGLSLLKEVPNVAAYLGWSGGIILNASRMVANREGIITLSSPFDGSKIKLSYAQLKELIHHIKPLAVLLPPKMAEEFSELWDNWDDSLLAFSNPQVEEGGIYWNVVNPGADAKKPIYRTDCTNIGVDDCWVEMDMPAQLGLDGSVVCSDKIVDLRDSVFALDFEVIDDKCSCPTCSAKLTKAYLHHLYLNTPLLCQRFLIQHNVYTFNHNL